MALKPYASKSWIATVEKATMGVLVLSPDCRNPGPLRRLQAHAKQEPAHSYRVQNPKAESTIRPIKPTFPPGATG